MSIIFSYHWLIFLFYIVSISLCLALTCGRRRNMNWTSVIYIEHRLVMHMIMVGNVLNFDWFFLKTCCKKGFALFMLRRELSLFNLFLHFFHDNSICLNSIYCCLSMIFNLLELMSICPGTISLIEFLSSDHTHFGGLRRTALKCFKPL